MNITGVDFICVPTQDFEKASAFYEDVGVLQYPTAAASAVLLTLVLVAIVSLILRTVDIRQEIAK